MRKIELLDKNTIDKIAAGEVVERPASVVKELMENAIDASATAITVEIKEGGKTFIRITDNGSGIEKEEVKKAFLRHATSKIRKVEDLQQVATLGFRGEALSSISAVSQMEVITKTSDALTGVRYRIEGGSETEFEEIGAPSGTTFLINHLFYNVPARAKFLKSAMAEGNRVAQVVEELALSHPEISFKFIMNGQNRLYTSGNGNLKEIVYQIYGRDMTRELITIDRRTDLLHVCGFIANPVVSRSNRNYENYFVNGRYVKSPIIAKAIEDGYHGFLMQHKYPFTLLYIEIDPTKVDVNVHPAKMEIRISEQEEVYHQLCLAIQNTLMERERIPEVTFGKDKSDAAKKGSKLPVINEKLPEPFERKRREAAFSEKKTDAFPGSSALREPAGKYGFSENHAATHPAKEGNYGSTISKARDAYPGIPEGNKAVYAGSLSDTPGKNRENTVAESVEAVPKSMRADAAKELPVGKQIPEEKESFITKELSDAQEIHDGKELSDVKERHDEKELSAEKAVPDKKPEQMNLFRDKVLSEEARSRHKIIGQIFGTFWIVEYEEKMYIIDQHAAHEKVLYERIMKNYREKKINSQMLYPARLVSLPAAEIEVLERNMDAFRLLGFEIEHFGGQEFKITAVPDNLFRIDTDKLFAEIMDELTSLGEIAPESIPEKLASMSCKAAIKGNHDYSLQEAQALIDELLKLENPYNCPHGRPTIISMSHYELDKKFKRIL